MMGVLRALDALVWGERFATVRAFASWIVIGVGCVYFASAVLVATANAIAASAGM